MFAIVVRCIQEQLGEQITEDFKSAFSPENAKNFTPTRQLAEGCLVISTLDVKWKRNLLKFFLSHQLAEYSIIFNDGEEAAWLDKVDNRYTWLKRHLMDFEGKNFLTATMSHNFCDIAVVVSCLMYSSTSQILNCACLN